MQGEAPSTDVEMVVIYSEDPSKTINKGGYIKKNKNTHIFSVDKTTLYWKMSSRSFITRDMKSMPVFKASKHILTLLLSTNAVGDFNLKPMLICHYKNP